MLTKTIAMEIHYGIIQFYLPERGFGYIQDSESYAEYHFTKRDLREEVGNKDFVRFEVGENKNGLFAKNIRKQSAFPKDLPKV